MRKTNGRRGKRRDPLGQSLSPRNLCSGSVRLCVRGSDTHTRAFSMLPPYQATPVISASLIKKRTTKKITLGLGTLRSFGLFLQIMPLRDCSISPGIVSAWMLKHSLGVPPLSRGYSRSISYHFIGLREFRVHPSQ